MEETATDASRVLLLFAALASALIIGALSHQRAEHQTRAQGLVRAGIVMVFVTVSFYALAGLMHWSPIYRVTPLLASTAITLVGLVWDAIDLLRMGLRSGPFGRVTLMVDRIRRRQ